MFLTRLEPNDQAALKALGTRRRYPAGAMLFFAGDRADELMIVLDGDVKVHVGTIDGRDVILDVMGEGELLGELSALDGLPRSAEATALTQLEVVAISNKRFLEFVQHHPQVLFQLTVDLATRLRTTTRHNVEFGAGDALGRLSSRLLEVAERFGAQQLDGTVRVESPVTQADLAAWTGLSREAVVKGLRALRALGWIENQGKTITVLDPAKLEARAAR
ncbi:MAG: Crp/Fnr family transcriptional regulator [Acidimicrobiia bacterium]